MIDPGSCVSDFRSSLAAAYCRFASLALVDTV